jgi:hypothetical protein
MREYVITKIEETVDHEEHAIVTMDGIEIYRTYFEQENWKTAIRAVENANLNYGHKEMRDDGPSLKDADKCEDARAALLALWQGSPAPRPSETVVTTEMVERGAEQLCLNHVSSGAIPWDDLGEVLRDIYRHDVRTILAAAQPARPSLEDVEAAVSRFENAWIDYYSHWNTSREGEIEVAKSALMDLLFSIEPGVE